MEAQSTAEGTESAQERKLSQEAARWRVRFREAERTISMLRNHIADLEARSHANSPAAELIAAELSTLRRTVEDLQEKQESAELRARDAEQRARAKTIHAALTTLVADSRLTDAAAAKVVLEQYAAVDDDDVVVFVVGDTRVPATLDMAREHGLLSSIFFKSARKRTPARRNAPATTSRRRSSQENAV